MLEAVIPTEVRTEILRRLKLAEQTHQVRILFAIESGSRAWGFASPNSDYDVRFVYMHEPQWYQAVDLEERRDVIEYPILDEIDLNGWDVRKALRLFWKSNPAFIEWIQSPITYIEVGAFREQATQVQAEIYNPEKGMYHYLSMAKTNFNGHLREPQVRLKKYFYVMRALLSARWIANKLTPAPIEFERLLVLLEDEPEVLDAVHRLLDQKRQSPELGLAPAVPELNQFIITSLAHPPQVLHTSHTSGLAIVRLNQIFHDVLSTYLSAFSETVCRAVAC